MDLKEFLKQKEGWKYKPYEDIGGKLTVGAGNTTDIDPDKTYTDPELDQRLDSDIAVAKEDYSKLVSLETDSKLNENQKNMVQSLLMNVGGTQFKDSQALKELNAGNFDNYLKEASEFRKVKDKIIPGLVNRRKEEEEIFRTVPNDIAEDGEIINASFTDDKISVELAKEIEAMNNALLPTNPNKPKSVNEEIDAMNKAIIPGTAEIKLPLHIAKPEATMNPIKKYWNTVVEESMGKDGELPSFMQMLENGYGKSVMNTANRFHDEVLFGSVDPFAETRLKEDIGFVERWVEGITTIAVDMPVYLLGAFLGNAATRSKFGAAFGAGYLAESLRSTYMDSLERGDVDTFSEWWESFAKEGHKAGMEAGFTFGVTAAAPGLIGAKGVIQTQATVLASLLGMHSLIKGKLPNKDEFIDTTLLVATFAAAHGTLSKSQQIYEKSRSENKSAPEVIEEIISNPEKLEVFASKNLDINKTKATKEVLIEEINEKTGEITHITASEKAARPVVEKVETKDVKESFIGPPKPKVEMVAETKPAEIKPTEIVAQQKEVLKSPYNENFEVKFAEGEKGFVLSEIRKDSRTLAENKENLKKLEEIINDTLEIESASKSPNKANIEQQLLNKTAIEIETRRLDGEKVIEPITEAKPTEIIAEQKEAGKPIVEEAAKEKAVEPVIEETIIPDVVRPEATTRVLENIELSGKPQKTKRSITKIGQDLITHLSDGLYPVFLARKAFLKNGGTFDGIDPVQLARNFSGQPSKVVRFLEDSTLDGKTLQPNGRPMMDIVDPVINDVAIRENFTAYAVSKRAVEKINEGKSVTKEIEIVDNITGEITTVIKGIKLEDAKATIEAYENAIVKGTDKTYGSVFRELVDYQKRVVQFMVDSGVLDQKQADAMFAANKDYVPFFRVLEDQIAGNQQQSLGNPFKAFKGSAKQLKDPIESIFKNTWTIITATERNRVNSTFIDMVKQNPELFPEIKRSVETDVSRITRAELEKIVDDPKMLNDSVADGMTIFRKTSGDANKIGEMSFLKDGKREVWNVGKDIAQALETLDQAEVNGFIKLMGTPTRLLRAGSVLNPDFIIASIERDSFGAAVHSKNSFIPLYSTAIGLAHVLKKTPEFKEFVSSGGFQAMIVSMDRTYFNKDIKNYVKKHRFRNRVSSPAEMLRVFMETTEASTRMGDYLLSKKRLKKQYPKMSEKDLIEISGFETKDLMNFSKTGRSFNNFNRLYAFANAQVRGFDKLVDSAKNRPFKLGAKTIAYVQMPTIALWLMNHDDPRYLKLKQIDKDLNWIFISGDGTVDEPDKYTVFRLRKPHDMGPIVGTGTEKVLNYLYSKDKSFDFEKAFGETLDTFGSLYNFGWFPDAIRPVAENWANESLYTGNPIYSAKGENVLPMFEYGPYTSEVGKIIGETLNSIGLTKISSPAQIDNIIKSYTGSLGRYALMGADAILEKTGVVKRIEMPDWELADYPIVKSFILGQPRGRSSYITNFLDKFKKDLPKINSYYKLVEEGQPEKANELFGDDLEKQLIIGPGEMIIDMFGMVKFIVENKTMSGDDKRKNTDQIYNMMIDVAKRGLENYDSLENRKGNK
jgi:GH24 family phage-related lysozyme (muramidase)